MNGVYLIIGGNLGNRALNLALCKKEISEEIGLILKQSSIYETAAWGITNENSYLNRVLFLETILTAERVMEICLEIEKKFLRVRQKKWESRIMDIDILFFNNEIIKTKKLQIPHPRMAERKFVLIPMVEIAPNLVHPLLDKSMTKMLSECEDTLDVSKVGRQTLNKYF
jgi:2-amino-4-hydroxy-6-hydroxymethyldihydropteridine diphosphokinase